MVGSGLRDDHHAHHRYTVHLHVTLQVGGTQFGITDVTQADDLSAYFLNHDIVELIGGMHLPHGAQGQLYSISFDASRRQLHVLIVHGILYVDWRNAIPRHLHRVEPQTHRITFLAPYRHAAHVGYRLELFFHGKVGYLAQLQERTVIALDSHHQNGAGIGISFRYRRRVTISGKVALGTRNLIAHIVRRSLQVNGKFKLYGNAALSRLAHAGERTDARNTIDVLFQRFGYLVFDNIGIGSGIAACHGYDGIVHRRIFTYAEGGIANHPEQEDDDGEHGGKHRPADAEFGNVHKAGGV